MAEDCNVPGPNETTQQIKTEICQQGPSRRRIGKLLVNWLQTYFASDIRPDLGRSKAYRWTRAVKTTEIHIEPGFRFTPEASNIRPAILILPGEVGFRKLSLGDRSKVFPDTGERRHYRLATGSHAVVCLHTEPDALEALADEIFDELTGFSPVIREEFNFAGFGLPTLGKVVPIPKRSQTEQKYSFLSVLPVVWAFGYGWSVKPAARTTRYIPVNVETT